MIERQIEPLQLAIEDLMIAAAKADAAPVNETDTLRPGKSCRNGPWRSVCPRLQESEAGARAPALSFRR